MTELMRFVPAVGPNSDRVPDSPIPDPPFPIASDRPCTTRPGSLAILATYASVPDMRVSAVGDVDIRAEQPRRFAEDTLADFQARLTAERLVEGLGTLVVPPAADDDDRLGIIQLRVQREALAPDQVLRASVAQSLAIIRDSLPGVGEDTIQGMYDRLRLVPKAATRNGAATLIGYLMWSQRSASIHDRIAGRMTAEQAARTLDVTPVDVVRYARMWEIIQGESRESMPPIRE